MTRRTPPPEQDALLPVEPEQRLPTANDLTRAWCAGYSETRHRQPHPNVVKRVGRVAKNIARDCVNLDDWRQAWQAAYVAGRRGVWDVTALLIDEHPPSLHQAKPSARSVIEADLRKGAIEG